MQNFSQNSIFRLSPKLSPTKLKTSCHLPLGIVVHFEEIKKIIEKKLNFIPDKTQLAGEHKPKIKSIPVPKKKTDLNLRSAKLHLFPKFSQNKETASPFIFKSLKMRSLTPSLRMIQSRSKQRKPLGASNAHACRIQSSFQSKASVFYKEKKKESDTESNISSSSENFTKARYS